MIIKQYLTSSRRNRIDEKCGNGSAEYGKRVNQYQYKGTLLFIWTCLTLGLVDNRLRLGGWVGEDFDV